jgi:hypothetical protein
MTCMVDGSRGVAPLLGRVAAGVTVCLLAGCGPTIARTVPSSPRLTKTSIVVQPSRFLAQGQRVRVMLRGFPPHVKVFVSECARLTGAAPFGCGNLPAAQPFAARTRRVLVTNGHGVAESIFVVQVVAETGPPGSRVAKCWPGCTMVAATGASPTGPAARAEAVIRFGERHPPPVPQARIPPSAPFTVLARIRIPGQAWQVLVSGGALYCLSEDSPGMAISRIDPATGHVGPSRPVIGAAAIGSGGGLLWIVQRSWPQHHRQSSLLALDPVTLAIEHTLALPQLPSWGSSGIAYAGGLIWVAGIHMLTAVNPATATVATTIPLGGAAYFAGVAAPPSGTVLWTTEGSPGGGPIAVQQRDPHTGAVLAGTNGPAAGAAGAQIAPATGHAWLAFPTGMLGSYIKVSAQGGRLTEIPPREHHVFANGIQVYIAGRQLWILDGMTGSIACASDATGGILAAAYDTALNISNLSQVAPGRFALPVNGEVLIVQPKPICGR